MPFESMSFSPVAPSNAESEQSATSAGLALTLGDGAQRVETPRDSRKEALLGLHIGRDRPKQRRLRLIGTVCSAQSLNGGIGLPSSFEQVVHAQPSVLR
jgi:hypothetical protein